MGKLINLTEAAAVLNRSPSTNSRAVSEGRLSFAPGTRLLERCGLEQRFAANTRPRVDCPMARQKVEGDAWWEEVAQLMNEKYLDFSSSTKWCRLEARELMVFLGCFEMAVSDVEAMPRALE